MLSVAYVLGVTRSILRSPCTRCMYMHVLHVLTMWYGMACSRHSVIGGYVTGGAYPG